MTKYKRYLRCGEGCVYFRLPNPKDKWGYCLIHKKQISKYKTICKSYIKQEDGKCSRKEKKEK